MLATSVAVKQFGCFQRTRAYKTHCTDKPGSRITDECLSIFNANGTIRKNQKAKLKDVLKFVDIHPKGYIAIIDAGCLWRLSTPKSDEYQKQKADGSNLTWHDYGLISHRDGLTVVLFLTGMV